MWIVWQKWSTLCFACLAWTLSVSEAFIAGKNEKNIILSKLPRLIFLGGFQVYHSTDDRQSYFALYNTEISLPILKIKEIAIFWLYILGKVSIKMNWNLLKIHLMKHLNNLSFLINGMVFWSIMLVKFNRLHTVDCMCCVQMLNWNFWKTLNERSKIPYHKTVVCP